jgi:hypothetical protein
MSNVQPSPLTERNPETHKVHRREVFWQILFPLIIGAIVCLALAILVGLGSNPTVYRWGDISIIWLVLLTILPSILVLAVLVALVYGLVRLLHVLPGFAYRVQKLLWVFQARVQRITDGAVEPVMKIHSFRAMLGTLRRKS